MILCKAFLDSQAECTYMKIKEDSEIAICTAPKKFCCPSKEASEIDCKE